MIGLFFRLVFWTMGALIVLTILALWAFCWAIVFVVSFICVAFDKTPKPKRLKRPGISRRGDRRSELDAFGQPGSQSRYRSRR